jgi:hypothetical protein
VEVVGVDDAGIVSGGAASAGGTSTGGTTSSGTSTGGVCHSGASTPGFVTTLAGGGDGGIPDAGIQATATVIERRRPTAGKSVGLAGWRRQ